MKPLLFTFSQENCAHSMRHGAASSLLADGATPTVVQRQVRHSDARKTLGIYGHVIGDEQRSAVQNRRQTGKVEASTHFGG
jgi:integrase